MIHFTCTQCGRQCCPTNAEEALVCAVCADGQCETESVPPDEAAQAVANAATVGEAVLDAAAAVRAERDQLRARMDELRTAHEALRVETGWAQKAKIRELEWLLTCYRKHYGEKDPRCCMERMLKFLTDYGVACDPGRDINDVIFDELAFGVFRRKMIDDIIARLRAAIDDGRLDKTLDLENHMNVIGAVIDQLHQGDDAQYTLAQGVKAIRTALGTASIGEAVLDDVKVMKLAAIYIHEYSGMISGKDETFARIPPLETAPDAPEFFLPAAGEGAYRVVNEYYAPWDMEIGGRDVPMRTRFLLVHEVPEDPFARGLEEDEAALAALLQARFAWAITPRAGEGPIRCAMRLLEEYAAVQAPVEQNNKRHDLDNMTVEDVVAMCNEVPGQSAHAVDGGMMVGYDESCGPVTIVAVAPKPTDPPAGFTPRQRALWTAIRTYGLALPGGGTTTLWEGSPDPVALCAALTGAGTLCPEDPALAPQVAAVLNSVRGVAARAEADGAVAFWPTTIGVTVDPDDPPDHCPEAL